MASILRCFLFIVSCTPAPGGKIFPSSKEVCGRILWAAGLERVKIWICLQQILKITSNHQPVDFASGVEHILELERTKKENEV